MSENIDKSKHEEIEEITSQNTDSLEKPKRVKRQHIMTEARKLSLQRANEKRIENSKIRKLEKEKIDQEEKQLLKNQILEKAEKIQKKEKKVKEIILESDSESDNIESENSEEEEIIIVKKVKSIPTNVKNKTIEKNHKDRLQIKPRKKSNVIKPEVDIFF
jgi:hypothetical protein